ncbi:MAG: TlpA family protein disulfide reductase [Deltaproteobacteria bacterium]|nr:TlpA family protein disulfide reductase [Deltaproteobacteria bacterium]
MNDLSGTMIPVVAVMLVSVLLAAPLQAQDRWTQIWKQSIEVPAPDFTLTDLEGKTVRLSDYHGQVVLLQFTNTTCPHCRAIIPYLKELYATYKNEGLVLLAIDIQETPERVSAYAGKYELPYPVLLDRDAAVALSYGIVGIPNLVLINRDGVIMCRQCRSIDILLDTLLKKGD